MFMPKPRFPCGKDDHGIQLTQEVVIHTNHYHKKDTVHPVPEARDALPIQPKRGGQIV